MTDKNLKELQDIIHDLFLLQSRMSAWQCHIVSGGEDGVTLDVYPHRYEHLRDAYDRITEAINLMMEEIGVEMNRREGKVKYDPRIKNEHCIRDPFDVEAANKYIGKRGYFTDEKFNFSNLDNCCAGMLASVESDNRHPYYCAIFDEGVIIKGNFSFFLPAEFVEEKPKEKKLRPYTLMEFTEKFPLGLPIKFRRKGGKKDEWFSVLTGYWHHQVGDEILTYIIIGPVQYTLDELFNHYEWQVHYTEDFEPFGVEE